METVETVRGMKRKIYLITQDFPYGNLETSFVAPELPDLQEEFDVTVLVTEWDIKQNEKKNVPCDAIILKHKFPLTEKIVSLFKLLWEKAFYQELAKIIRGRHTIIGNLKRALMYGIYAELFWSQIVTACDMNSNSIFYFYWWDYKCLALTMHKKKYPDIRIVTRTHNYDLYHFREETGRQFYKEQMDQYLDRVFFIAEYGKKYYLDNYDVKDCNRYIISRLGVPRQSVNSRTDTKLLLSCSTVIPVKRVGLIVDALQLINDVDINWVHIGTGIDMPQIEEKAREKLGYKKNIHYEFMGEMDNSDVIHFYRENAVRCFITTTEIEGNPVSVQEALSFGMPIIGTSVSDIPLMIDGNGVLLTANPEPDEISQAIQYVFECGAEQIECMQKKSLEIWNRDYDAKKNVQFFVNELKKL